jgi:hypothetical protein
MPPAPHWLVVCACVPLQETHWSLRPIADPVVPPVTDSAWPITTVDRFLLAKMEAAEVEPAQDAPPGQRLRRLHFDLIGLPPSPAQLNAFSLDPSEEHYAEVVDELIASPEFGQRWGRHWLDVTRFAESSGGGRSLVFPDAWRYRDYVIDSYNQDVPFDQFIAEQLAGDLLPSRDTQQRNRQLTATGFLLLGPTNYEQQDKEFLRLDVIDEQIDTLGRAFLAQSFGCARCHDHKFDPVSSADYYALAGIFSSTQALTPGNVSGWVKRELEGERRNRWHEHRRLVTALEGKIAALQTGPPVKAVIDRESLQGIVLDDSEATLIGEWQQSTFTPGYLEDGYLHDKNQVQGGKSVTFVPEIPSDGLMEVRLSYTPGSNRASNARVVIECADGRHETRLSQRERPPIQGTFVSLGVHRFTAGMDAVIIIDNDAADGHVIVDALQLLPAELQARGPATPDQHAANQEELAMLRARLAELNKDTPPAPESVMAVSERVAPSDEAIRLGGLPRELGEVVPRGAPALAQLPAPEIPTQVSGREELAHWVGDPRNPLTSRVYVNRVWRHLFGEGLVRTPDNFGIMGEKPSHPELLDHLALAFMQDGWSTKRLIRSLVLSRAYRMEATPPQASDHENRLFSRANRRRLDADAMRDALLSVSGELDLTRGGLTIRKLELYDYGYQFSTLRRSVYVPRFRNSELDMFAVFDDANPNTVSGARGESQVPPQALFLMNSPWMTARAQASAKRLLVEIQDDTARIRHAFLLALGREPSPQEQALFEATLKDNTADPQETWAALMHTLLACLDFRYLS